MRKALLALTISALMGLSLPSMAATQTIIAAGATFAPPVVVAGSNDTIRLQNSDALIHTLTLNSNSPLGGRFCRNSLGQAITCSTGIVGQGGVGSFTLVSAPTGTYRFFCEVHANMHGILQVV